MEQSRSREADGGRPLRRQATTLFASSRRPTTPTGATNLSPMTMTWDKATSVDSCTTRRHSKTQTFIHQYYKYLSQMNAFQLNGSRTFIMPVSACMDVFTKKRVAMWDMANPKSVQSTLALQRNKPLKTTVAKYECKNATCLKCDSDNHKVVNCPKCAPGESERLLKEKMDKCESARNKKVTKLQGSANKSLGREAKIEGIVSVTMTLLDTGSDIILVIASVMKSLERDSVEIKVISPEPSVIQPYGQAPALKVGRQLQFKLVTLDTRVDLWPCVDSRPGVSRLTQVAASSDECGDDGMHCATPNIQVPSAEDAEGE
ncbi:hypothetical protein B5M09_012637, partial [Aphanomyces astaci]